jgi:hypothetical protein
MPNRRIAQLSVPVIATLDILAFLGASVALRMALAFAGILR